MHTNYLPLPLQALVLRANIEEAKRARNILQKRLKEEGFNHNAEKKKLQVIIPPCLRVCLSVYLCACLSVNPVCISVRLPLILADDLSHTL